MLETEKQWEDSNWTAWRDRYGLPRMDCPGGNITRVEILASRNGRPTVRVAGRNDRPVFLHSSVDPEKEAERLAAGLEAEPGTVMVVYGFGLGYLVEALLATLHENIPLFVLEPDAELFCAAMKTRDLSHIIADGRVLILVGDSPDNVNNRFVQIYDTARYTKVLATGLPGHQTVYADFCAKAAGSIRDAMNTRQIQLRTMIKIGPEVITNAILNLVDYYTLPGLRSLFGKFTDVPAIIVSAGPSLNKNIDLLHEAKGKAVILAVGTAAKALQKRGIEPDFIVSIDPGIPNYVHFKGLRTNDACLITEMQSHHQILKEFAGPIFVSGQTPVLQWFDGVIEDKGVTESGGSVANNALSAAYKMGANPIIMIGQDLAYARDGHTHAAGTTYENDVVNRDTNRGYIYVKANDGGEVLTDAAFYQFLSFFVAWIKKFPDREYINATEGGAFIEGTKVETLRESLDRFCCKPVDVQEIIRRAQAAFVVPGMKPLIEGLKPHLNKMEQTIAEAKTAMKQLKQLKKACESRQGKKMRQLLAAVRKIYERFSEDEFISVLPEWLAKQDVYDVMSRTHQAELTANDDFNAAIADYNIYYQKICDGAEKVKSLIETSIQEAERRMQDDE